MHCCYKITVEVIVSTLEVLKMILMSCFFLLQLSDKGLLMNILGHKLSNMVRNTKSLVTLQQEVC
jgi:hypothetical protein